MLKTLLHLAAPSHVWAGQDQVLGPPPGGIRRLVHLDSKEEVVRHLGRHPVHVSFPPPILPKRPRRAGLDANDGSPCTCRCVRACLPACVRVEEEAEAQEVLQEAGNAMSNGERLRLLW